MACRETRLPIDGGASLFDFEKAGDEFPVHVHAVGEGHITLVLRGEILEVVSGQSYGAGDVIDWAAGEPHGFRALEARTRIANISKRR